MSHLDIVQPGDMFYTERTASAGPWVTHVFLIADVCLAMSPEGAGPAVYPKTIWYYLTSTPASGSLSNDLNFLPADRFKDTVEAFESHDLWFSAWYRGGVKMVSYRHGRQEEG